MKELVNTTITVAELNWYFADNTYPATYYNDLLPDIMRHQEYSWFLCKVTLDTTGVWAAYPKTVDVRPDNNNLSSSHTTPILYRRFQPAEKVSFTVLLYGEYGYSPAFTSDYGYTDIYTATFITRSLFDGFIGGYNTMLIYMLANVIDSTVPLSIEPNTGLRFVFTFDSTVNYNQAYKVSYQLYGIM